MADERDRFIKRVLAAEAAFPVETWKVNGIHVWPLIRIQLFFSWFNAWKRSPGRDGEGAPDATAVPTAPAAPAAPRGRGAITHKSSYLRFITGGLLSWFRLRQLTIPVTSFLFCGAYTHRIVWEGAFYNRYFDPFIRESGEGILLEYQREKPTGGGEKAKPGYVHPGYAHPDKVYELEEYLPWFQLKQAIKTVFSGRKQKLELHEYDRFLEQFKDVNTGQLLPARLSRLARQVEDHASMYAYFMKKSKARYYFGLCYYSIPMYGMDLAARRCGGISVDMQHGTQGSTHIAYTTWSRVPPEGYELLPHWFWVWDEGSRDVITGWSEPTVHQVFLGGNPALHLTDPGYIHPALRGKPVILYTLQPLGQVIEPFIIDTIKQTAADYTWWLRFHPRHTETERAEIADRLRSHGLLDEVELREANQLPLPVILRNTAVHLSRFSGSIIEGVQMGVPSIVIDETGAATFADLLQSGRLAACVDENAATLTAVIRALNDQNNRKEKAGNKERGAKTGSIAAAMERFIQKASLRK